MKIPPTQSGFSLIETLVAITILLIVIIGPLSITSSAARSTSFASDQVTAFFLAQEGAELIQKVRDDLLLRQFLPTTDSRYISNPWTEFVRTSGGVQLQNCYTAEGCAVMVAQGSNGTLTPNILTRCQSGACRLYYNEDANTLRSRYTHTAASAAITPFTRAVKISILNNFEVRVRSEVTWRSGLTSDGQMVVVENHLFNIYAN
jgi:prepilin-type N-terminal cleavage/methylation domain-containing protein